MYAICKNCQENIHVDIGDQSVNAARLLLLIKPKREKSRGLGIKLQSVSAVATTRKNLSNLEAVQWEIAKIRASVLSGNCAPSPPLTQQVITG